MAKSKGIDLSKFKHVSSDKHSTRLKHDDGHFLVIAHKGVKGDLKAHLDALSADSQKTVAKPDTEHLMNVAKDAMDTQDKAGYNSGGAVKSGSKDMDYAKGGEAKPKYGFGEMVSSLEDSAAKLGEKIKGGPSITQEGSPPTTSEPRGGDTNTSARARDTRYGGQAPTTSQAQGGEIRKMYADTPEEVSQSDSAPTQDQASVDTSVPNYAAPAAPMAAPQPQGDAQVPMANTSSDQSQTASQAQPMASAAPTAQAPDNSGGAIPVSEPTPTPAAQAAKADDVTSKEITPNPIDQYMAEKAPTKSYLDQHALAFQQDLANGHISPKTIGDMFADRSLPGKISMIFGMMLSGAGSGITGQPNALMGLMQKQIDNDLAAQEKSKDNAVNYLRINQEALKNEANTKYLDAEARTKAWALAQGQMLQGSFHTLANDVTKMPEGPMKEAAKQQLAVIYSKIGDKINNVNDQVAGATAYNKMLFGNQNSGATGEQKFQQDQRGLRMLGPEGEKRADYLEQHHIPGVGTASEVVTPDIRAEMAGKQEFHTLAKQYLDFAKKNANNWANLNPAQRLAISNQGATLAADLQGAYRRASKGGVFKEGEQNFIERLIPSKPDQWGGSFRTLPKVEALINNNQIGLNQLKKSYGVTEDQAQPQTKTIGKDTYTKTSGGWQKVK